MALPELKDGTQSRQKAQYVSANADHTRGKSKYLELTYKRLDGPNPGLEMTTGNFLSELSPESLAIIKTKGEFVVVKTKDGKFWPLTSVESIDTYVAKAPSTFNGGNKGGYVNKSSGGTFNNAGIKVGACAHDACTLVGQGGTVAQVKKIVEELLYMSYELEQNVNDGKYDPKKNATKSPLEVKSEDVDTTDDSLDNIDF